MLALQQVNPRTPLTIREWRSGIVYLNGTTIPEGSDPLAFVNVFSTTVTSTKQEVAGYGCVLKRVDFKNNDGAADAYLQLFNAPAASVTVGTTTPLMVLPLVAGGQRIDDIPLDGIAFNAGLTVAVTTTRGGSTAPASAADVGILWT